MPLQSQYLWYHYWNNIGWELHRRELQITQFSPSSCHFFPWSSNFFLNTPIRKTVSLCYSLNKNNQFAHAYKATYKFVAPSILSFFKQQTDRQKVLERMVFILICFGIPKGSVSSPTLCKAFEIFLLHWGTSSASPSPTPTPQSVVLPTVGCHDNLFHISEITFYTRRPFPPTANRRRAKPRWHWPTNHGLIR